MNLQFKKIIFYAAILLAGIFAPIVFPAYTFQLALLWMMILFALTWDILGGQMGYNSLGNILFFGAGMYICTVVQIGMYYDVAEYTAHFGAVKIDFTPYQYFTGISAGLVIAAFACAIIAVIFGWIVFGLRGPYFAIGTLGVAIAAGELVGAWDYVGGGGGISLPNYPGGPGDREMFFYMLCFISAVCTFIFLKWLYSTRFQLALNAIRDDEEKAEAMGIHTNGIFMVLMVLLGGKGTLWGPVIGAIIFHVIKEITWTYLLGWQWVALGALIIINVVYFQQGIMGWAQEKWPEFFGITVDEAITSAEENSPAEKEASL